MYTIAHSPRIRLIFSPGKAYLTLRAAVNREKRSRRASVPEKPSEARDLVKGLTNLRYQGRLEASGAEDC